MHRVLLVGRSQKADIRVDHPTVSRLHLELVVGRAGEIYVADRSSSNGTRLEEDGVWRRVTARTISPGTRLRLGDATVSVSELLRRAGRPLSESRQSEPGNPRDDLPSGRVRRDPETGELVPY